MTIDGSWSPRLDPDGPTHLALSRALEADIRSGRLAPGARLPTHRALAASLGVNVGTVSRAYAEARRRGLLSGEVGRGTFVRRPGGPALASRARGADDVLDLGLNAPLASPAPDLRAALRALAARSDLRATTEYGDPAGAPRARAAGASWMRRYGLDVAPEQIVVCNGSQHGILVALAAFAGPGELVLAEALTYPGFTAAARLLGLRVRGVATDEEGVVPEALEAACADRPRLLYCMPGLQNPTAAVASPARLRAIAEIARANDLVLLVDDVQAPVLEASPARDESASALGALAPERTITLAGVSKLLLPGLRTAFLAAAPDRIGRLSEVVWASTWMASPLGAELAAGWIEDGTAERIVAARREEMRLRGELARRALAGLRFHTRPGAHHLWLELPTPFEASGFAGALARRGVAVVPAEAFLAAPGPAPRAVRVSLSAAPDLRSLARGLEAIADVARGGVEPNPVRL
jgi:DNA-binding transcriptional MocR family regulator